MQVHVILVFNEVFIYLFPGTWIQCQEQKSIPDYLLSCYRTPPSVLPQTIETLVEIIQKLETAPSFNMDLKMFSNALLHK